MAANLASRSYTFKQREICWNNFNLGVTIFNIAKMQLVVLFSRTAWLTEQFMWRGILQFLSLIPFLTSLNDKHPPKIHLPGITPHQYYSSRDLVCYRVEKGFLGIRLINNECFEYIQISKIWTDCEKLIDTFRQRGISVSEA